MSALSVYHPVCLSISIISSNFYSYIDINCDDDDEDDVELVSLLEHIHRWPTGHCKRLFLLDDTRRQKTTARPCLAFLLQLGSKRLEVALGLDHHVGALGELLALSLQPTTLLYIDIRFQSYNYETLALKKSLKYGIFPSELVITGERSHVIHTTKEKFCSWTGERFAQKKQAFFATAPGSTGSTPNPKT